jgi:hypothetical protein
MGGDNEIGPLPTPANHTPPQRVRTVSRRVAWPPRQPTQANEGHHRPTRANDGIMGAQVCFFLILIIHFTNVYMFI